MSETRDRRQRQAIKRAVVERYSERATHAAGCCVRGEGQPHALTLYAEGELVGLPASSVAAAAGCGNPLALAELKEGQTVVDLGSGGGTDAFLASRAVGPAGRVIGVDMTPAMVALARRNAERLGVTNVEFHLAEIEALPVPDEAVDLVISNCVINLSLDKDAVFREAYRVLKPGGRLIVSDMVLTTALPEEVANDRSAWAACVSGALPRDEYLAKVRLAGFSDLRVQGGEPRPSADGWRKHVASMTVIAAKAAPTR